MHQDPKWPRAGEWLPHARGGQDVGIVGVPLSRSITPGRCDLAPKAFREALQKFTPYDVRHNLDLTVLSVEDWGDLELPSDQSEAVSLHELLNERLPGAVVLLGGDNGITYPGVLALASARGLPLDQIGLLTFDAHFDLRDLEGGLMNGNPIRALLRDGLPGENIVQLGIQSFVNSQAYAEVAREAGIHFVPMDDLRAQGVEAATNQALDALSSKCQAIYVDFDLDVMDRAFAPGCPGSRPGGLTPADLQQAAFLCGENRHVHAIDLVELDPTKDLNGATALAGAMVLLSFLSGRAKAYSH